MADHVVDLRELRRPVGRELEYVAVGRARNRTRMSTADQPARLIERVGCPRLSFRNVQLRVEQIVIRLDPIEVRDRANDGPDGRTRRGRADGRTGGGRARTGRPASVRRCAARRHRRVARSTRPTSRAPAAPPQRHRGRSRPTRGSPRTCGSRRYVSRGARQRLALRDPGESRAPAAQDAERAVRADGRIEERRDRDDIGARRARPVRRCDGARVDLDQSSDFVRAMAQREMPIGPGVNV